MQLEVSNVSIELGAKGKKRRILDDVSFSVPDGSFVSLLGASGAGKSTLLKIVAGVLVQDEGSVLFDGVPVDDLPPHKRKLGFVFQDMRLFPNMNVEDNVAFTCKMQGMKKKERLARAHEFLERVQLGGFGQREVRSLSGGQQQRVALARALAGKPQALLLDEPFSGLDENLRDEMRSLVLDLQRDEHVTAVMVTHDAMEALAMSEKVVYMSAGRIVQDGAPAELFTHPATVEVAACFGDCSTLEGTVENGLFHAGKIALPAPGAPDGPAEAVVRFKGSAAAPAENGDALGADGERVFAGSARVDKVQYRGSDTLAHLNVEGRQLVALCDGGLAEGDWAEVAFARDAVFVFPKARQGQEREQEQKQEQEL